MKPRIQIKNYLDKKGDAHKNYNSQKNCEMNDWALINFWNLTIPYLDPV